MNAEELFDANDALFYAYSEELYHVGVGWDHNPPGVGSSRYPHGSGDNPYQHDRGTAGAVARLKKQGMSMPEIALALGFYSDKDPTRGSTDKLRIRLSLEKELRIRNLSESIPRYKAKGMSNQAIADKLGCTEGLVRRYLKADSEIKIDRYMSVANSLEEELKRKKYIDVGAGVEKEIGNVSRQTLDRAVQILKEKGYKVHDIRVSQLGNPNQYTNMKILGQKDTTWAEVQNNPQLVRTISTYFQDGGRTAVGLQPIKSMDFSRVYINYTDQNGNGGAERDGVILLRRGVDDISLGNSIYAQVRIGVNGTHYMKGMAVYSDRIPDGYDVVYNTNKKFGTDPFAEDGGVFKMMKRNADGTVNLDNPFGATIKDLNAGGQSYYTDQNGKQQLRVINKVNDVGDWLEWKSSLSPQFLAKQDIHLVKKQLELTYLDRVREFEEIKSLTNPEVKIKMAESFANDCDAAASHLKAKAFPGQTTNVIIAVPDVKQGECFCPNYEHGAKLACVRFPHAGPFEILTVTNNLKTKQAIDEIGLNAPDAIGLNGRDLSVLSGADSDGDTVVVIPLDRTKIHVEKPLAGLAGFDTKSYKFADPKAVGITTANQQTEMGKITNLIQDMEIAGASMDKVERAVRHSMVVIDAEKHHLDYKKSFKDNGIQALRDEFQGKEDPTKPSGGANTLLTRAGSEVHIPVRRVGTIEYYDDNGVLHRDRGIDRRTGKLIWEDTGRVYDKVTIEGVTSSKARTIRNLEKVGIDRDTISKKTGVSRKKIDTILSGEGTVKRKETVATETVTRMDTVDDAMELLSSKTHPAKVEVVYAHYANSMKDLANQARLIQVNTPHSVKDKEAAKKYEAQCESLMQKLLNAESNAPREREALRLATARYKQAIKDNPLIELNSGELSRLRGQCLTGARLDVGAKKPRIEPTELEKEAIRNGAFSSSVIRRLLNNMDDSTMKELALPRTSKLTPALESRIKALAGTATNEQIAMKLGISVSLVKEALYGKK